MDTVEKIRFIEELAMNAWPAETIQIVDGWRLRYNQGVSRRTNSVWPNAWGGAMPLALKMGLVDDFYQRRSLPSRYQICPAARPEGLDDVLEAASYSLDAPTRVQMAELADTLAKSESRHQVQLEEQLTDEWFQAYTSYGTYSAMKASVVRGSLERTGPLPGYALIRSGGDVVAVGRAAYERGWMGIFSMATEPTFRRQGMASSILYTLVAWGQRQGARKLYLQVEEENTVAQAVYARFGFEDLYGYHYREAPAR
jgi:RimJ/RimL family protein N-acetyltransferase